VNEPTFLTLDEVFRIHARSVAEHGGSDGMRDPGLVESALASAKNIFYYARGDVFDVAAGYAFHLAESQAFVDGDKRQRLSPRWFFSRGMAFMSSPRRGSFIQP
jgi:death-on-curing protein